MASKCCGDKAVVVAVYAENPRGRGKGGRHRHHHHHHYHNFHQNQTGDGEKARGYNRRAELLDYARHLRSPAQSNVSHPPSHIKQLSTLEVLGVDGTRKKKHCGPLNGCFQKWGFVFLKTTTTHNQNKMSLVKSLQKTGSFFSKLLAALQKR